MKISARQAMAGVVFAAALLMCGMAARAQAPEFLDFSRTMLLNWPQAINGTQTNTVDQASRLSSAYAAAVWHDGRLVVAHP
jgi:hypothetical protein